MAQTMNLWRAIAKMKEISAAGGTFSFKFRKWNTITRKGGDTVHVPEARLRPKASDEAVEHASHKLFYYDVATGTARNCWQPLITEFNGIKTILE